MRSNKFPPASDNSSPARRGATSTSSPGTACSMVSSSCSMTSGLAANAFMPAARHCSRSSVAALAVNAMIGMSSCVYRGNRPAASSSRISRAAVSPSISGIWQSIRIASYSARCAAATASMPLLATSTSQPDILSSSTATIWLISLSSASSRRPFVSRNRPLDAPRAMSSIAAWCGISTSMSRSCRHEPAGAGASPPPAEAGPGTPIRHPPG